MAGYTLPRHVAISIAGLGDPATGLPLRLSPVDDRTVSGSGRYVRLMKRRSLGQVSAEARPFDGETTLSSVKCELVGFGSASQFGPQVLAFLTKANPDPVALLFNTVTAAATQLEAIPIPGRAAIAANDTLYLEREAMIVTSVSAGTGTGGSDQINVTRGKYGTKAAAHKADYQADIEIFTDNAAGGSGNPIVESREVTLWAYDPVTDTDTKFWRGYLGIPKNSKGVITIDAEDMWSVVFGAKLGVNAWSALGIIYRSVLTPGVSVSTIQPRTINYGSILVSGKHLMVSDGTVVIAAETYVRAEGPGGTDPSWLDLAPYPKDASAATGHYNTLYGGVPDRDNTDPSAMLADTMIREVLTSAPGYSHFRDSSGNLSSHPFDIVVCILISTGTATWTSGGGFTAGINGNQDCLPEPFGRGVDPSDVDIAGIDALKADPAYAGLEMEGLIIGAEGPVETSEILNRIFRATFTFPTTNATGQLTIKDMRDPGAGNADFVVNESSGLLSIITHPLETSRTMWPLINEIMLKIARRGLTDKYSQYIDSQDLRQINVKRYIGGKTEDVEIDCGDFGQVTPGGIAPPDFVDRIRALFSWYDLLRTNPLPIHEFTTDQTLGLIPPGSIVDLSCPALLDGEGGEGFDNHPCLVVDVKHDLWSLSNKSVVAIDLYPVTRAGLNTAPAWMIEDVTSSTVFDIYQDQFTEATEDEITWRDGAKYLLFDKHGVLRSTDGPTTGSISSVTVTLDAAWTASSSPVTPSSGDVIRPAAYDDRGTDWGDVAYIADSNGQLGTANDLPHRWGF